MCNHYRNLEKEMREWAELERAIIADIDNTPDPNVWPKRQGYVLRNESSRRVIETMQWGVPLTVPGKREGTTRTKYVTNVRNLQSSFWKSMLSDPAQRCLVPFAEFAEPKPGKDPETGRPAEWWFSIADRQIAAFAGIWRPSKAGNVYAFLTCAPNAVVKPKHPKAMPVILAEEDYEQWLTGSYDEVYALAEPFPSQLMSIC